MSRQPTNLASRRERPLAERAARSGQPARSTRAQRPAWQSPMALITGVAVLAGVVIVAFVLLTSQRASPTGTLIQPPVSPAAQYANGDNSDATGPASAPVTLDVYSDFQCPGCGNFAKQGLGGLVNEFVAAGQLRIVDHALDILSQGTSESTDAAVAATCAGRQGKYWQFHDYLFWNQSGENQGSFSLPRLQQMADAVGVDRGQWDTCMKDEALKAEINGRAKAAGISSTPTFVLNGQQVTNLKSYSDLADRIRALLPGGSGSPSGSATPSGSAPSGSPAASVGESAAP